MFSQIYDIAKKAETLDELESLKDVFLDVKENKFPFITPAEKLASEGYTKAAEFLRELGADVNYIARGYARSNIEQAELYCRQYKVRKDIIVQGYVLGGHHDIVATYQKKYNLNPGMIAFYYASINDIERAENYLAIQPTKENYHSMAIGSAAANNIDHVAHCNAKYLLDVNEIVGGYIVAGNQDMVEKYRLEHKANVSNIALNYALIGDKEKVEFYKENYNANPNVFIQGFIFLGWEKLVEEYQRKYKIDVNIIAQYYAITSNHQQVEYYRQHYNANVNAIVQGYIIAGNENKICEYKTNYPLDKNTIAYNYAFLGNQEKVNECLNDDPDTLHAIVQGFAIAGKDQKVEYYRRQDNTLIHSIAQGYKLAGDSAKVKEYETRHNAVVTEGKIYGFPLPGNFNIETYYDLTQASEENVVIENPQQQEEENNDVRLPDIQNAPLSPFDLALQKLSNHGVIGQNIILSMERLKVGQEKQYHPYWINSGKKLEKIIKAVNLLDNSVSLNLDSLLKDKESDLYQALNFTRISGLTCFGQFSFSKTKTLLTITEKSNLNLNLN